jgi:hypothetical protein
MHQENSTQAAIDGIVCDLRKRVALWRDYVSAVKNSSGLDMDFPDADERVAHAWELNAQMLQAAEEIFPSIRSNFRLHRAVNEAAWRAAQEEI